MSCAYVLVIPSDYRALDKRSPMIASCRRFWFTFGGRGIAMHGAFKFVAIFGVGFSLASHTPLPAFPASTLDALDPSHLATLFCGAEQAGSTLARELLIASAIAAPASEAGPIPLLDPHGYCAGQCVYIWVYLGVRRITKTK